MGITDRIATSFPTHAAMWIQGEHEPETVRLAFYRQHVLVRIRNDVSDPDAEFAYLLGNDSVIHLDGRLDSIQRANQAENLHLTCDQVPAYLLFVFAHAGKGQLTVVEQAHELSWSSEALADALVMTRVDQARALIHPIEVSLLPNNNFRAVLNGMFKDLLVECVLEVEPTGKLNPLGQKPLLADLPVTHSWPCSNLEAQAQKHDFE